MSYRLNHAVSIVRTTAVVFAFVGSLAGVAQVVAETPAKIDDETRAKVIEWTTETLSRIYVDSTTAQRMIDLVRTRAREGAYARMDDAGEFLSALGQDLRSVSDDKHIRLWTERPEDVKADDVDYTPADSAYVESLRRNNFGYKKIEILPGNVGYLRIDEFAHFALGGPTTVAVMNTLANVDALIIDLRWNGGGAGMTALVSAYFFDQPTHLNDVWQRASGETQQSWTPEYVPGPSLSATPLYVLISGQTFSAAEDFVYALKHLGRATVVGARSKGGGHPVEFARLVQDQVVFAMMVPNAKSLNRITGTSWEGVGVAPDIAVPAHQALETAYNAAADGLLKSSKDERQRRLIEWSRAQFLADQHVTQPTAVELAEYVGTYENYTFAADEEGVLIYQRDVGSNYPLVSMGDNLFRFEGYDALRFRFGRAADGRVDRVITVRPDGTSEVHPRTE